jgi:hypothetical protein
VSPHPAAASEPPSDGEEVLLRFREYPRFFLAATIRSNLSTAFQLMQTSPNSPPLLFSLRKQWVVKPRQETAISAADEEEAAESDAPGIAQRAEVLVADGGRPAKRFRPALGSSGGGGTSQSPPCTFPGHQLLLQLEDAAHKCIKQIPMVLLSQKLSISNFTCVCPVRDFATLDV